MKIKYLPMLFSFLFMACTSKTETTVTTTVDSSNVQDQIKQLSAAHATAFNTRNLEGILAHYADDAQTYESGQEPMMGKNQIRTTMQAQLKSMVPGMTLRFDSNDIISSPDGLQVVETGTYSVSDETGLEMGGGYYMSVYKKTDGKYLCIRQVIVDGADPDAEEPE
jgi:uncharacterized protein (TIGR02246 family)